MNPEDAEEYTQALGQIGGGFWRQILLAQRMGVPEALGMSTREWVDERLGGYVRLSIPERREAAKELTLQEGLSTRQVADVLGIRHTTVERDLSGTNVPALLALQAQNNPMGGTNVPPTALQRHERQEREAEAKSRRERVEERNAEMADRLALGNGIQLHHGDFRSSLDHLFGQVDAIITDPPYGADALHLYDALGDLSKRLLKISGILVVMVGGAHLPEYLTNLGKHMRYRWCGAYITDGPATRIQGRKVGTKWKPILIYGGERFITQDVFSSDAKDKRFHHWGQSESGMADIVSRLTDPGQLIVDPFLGAGTTAVVCRDLGRRFEGCDIDQIAIEKTRARLS